MHSLVRWFALFALFAVLAPAPAHATTGPATLLKDINPSGTATPRDFTAVGSALFFSADDGVHGRELWKSNGTQAGTTMIKDIALGATGALTATHVLTDVNGTLFFAADDGVHGRELWKSDGTEAGTMLVKDVAPGADAGLQPNDMSSIAQVANLKGTFFFGASGAVWKSDGSEAGTVRVAAVAADRFVVVNDQLFFTSGLNLWKSDGSEAGTTLITSFPDTPGCDNRAPLIDRFIGFKGRLFLTFATVREGKYNYCNTNRHDMWVSDGTPTGTQLFQKFAYDVTVMGGALYYTDSERIYKGDGIYPGTEIFRNPDIRNYPYFNIVQATSDKLWFNFSSLSLASGQWISDGTTGGTMMLTSVRCTRAFTEVRANLTLFIAANQCGGVDTLWQTDGTQRGTRFAQNIAPSEIILVGNKVFLAADDGAHGSELWVAPSSAFGATVTTALPFVQR